MLVKRIYAHTDRVAARHPEIEFVKAPYLNDHPAVLDAFAERVEETLHGANLMNCKLCKYRERILGFESEKGLPQESHHHHVEGIGTSSSDGRGRDRRPGRAQGHEPESGSFDHHRQDPTIPTPGTITVPDTAPNPFTGTITGKRITRTTTPTGTTIPTRTPATPSAPKTLEGNKG